MSLIGPVIPCIPLPPPWAWWRRAICLMFRRHSWMTLYAVPLERPTAYEYTGLLYCRHCSRSRNDSHVIGGNA